MKKYFIFFEHLPLTLFIFLIGLFLKIEIYGLVLIILFGWMIDADHLVDLTYYFYKEKKIKLNLIYNGLYFKKNKKIFIPLHSFEITFLFILIFLTSLNHLYLLVALSHLLHLLQDKLTYKINYIAYSIIFRLFKRFDYEKICT